MSENKIKIKLLDNHSISDTYIDFMESITLRDHIVKLNFSTVIATADVDPENTESRRIACRLVVDKNTFLGIIDALVEIKSKMTNETPTVSSKKTKKIKDKK
jgi:hypothetical protein